MVYFSVIIPTYNRANLLDKAIESILNQSFSDWELIIVDDGSTDNTKEVVEKYPDDRIKYIYQSNAERSIARNNGISHSKGKYICFLDSDDKFTSNRLGELYNSIKKRNEPVALFFTAIKFDNRLRIDNHNIQRKHKNENVYDFIIRAVFHTPQACIHKTILTNHQFNPSFRIGEDMELWIRIAENFPVIYLSNQHTIIITEHENRSVNLRKNNSALEHLQMLQHIVKAPHSGKNISKSVRQESLSNCYFNIAKHYMLNNRKRKAFYWTMRSILKSPMHGQNKHRWFCIKELSVGRIPDEYNLYSSA